MLTLDNLFDERDLSGHILVKATPGNLAELRGLAEELDLRMNIETERTITHTAPVQPGEA